MASVRKKGRYTGEDLVDEFILGKVSEYVDVSRLSDFAKALNVTETDYQRISGSAELPKKQQVYEVRKEMWCNISELVVFFA